MKIAEIRSKLHLFIDTAEPKKVKALYTILEKSIEEKAYQENKIDKRMSKLLEARSNEKSIPWETVKAELINSGKIKAQKKKH